MLAMARISPAVNGATCGNLADMISAKPHTIDREKKNMRNSGFAGKYRLYDRAINVWVEPEDDLPF